MRTAEEWIAEWRGWNVDPDVTFHRLEAIVRVVQTDALKTAVDECRGFADSCRKTFPEQSIAADSLAARILARVPR